jgi:molybdate transport system substrate-binding protein
MLADLRVISSKAPAALMPRLLERLCGPMGLSWEHEALGGVEAAARIRMSQGMGCDIAVLERAALEALAEEGLILSSSLTDVVLSRTAIATAQDVPAPDVASVAGLTMALRASPSIGYSTGPSGRALLRLIEQWGLLRELQDRLIQAPAGVPVGRLMVEGRVAMGFQQLSELRGMQGLHILGLMPPGAEIDTVFSAAVLSVSVRPELAARVVAGMASAELAALRRECGFDEAPVRRGAGSGDMER